MAKVRKEAPAANAPVAAKKEKAPKAEKPTFDVTVKSLADKFGTTQRKLRMFLRAKFVRDEEDLHQRYGWNKGDPELAAIEKAWEEKASKPKVTKVAKPKAKVTSKSAPQDDEEDEEDEDEEDDD